MSGLFAKNALRFIILTIFQVFVLKRINIGWEGFFYVHIILYPLFIILLPLRTPMPIGLLLSFLIGIVIDFAYDSPGVHASASVFTYFIRPSVLSWFAPRDGYNTNYSPTIERFGRTWFMRYCSVMLILHLFFYFSVEAFTFAYILDIFMQTVFSFIISMLFIFIYMQIFKPEE